MCKRMLVVLTVLAIACTVEGGVLQSSSRGNPLKKYHHHHGLRYLTHYWIFLAIKAKIIFLIGTFISFWLFAGKAFAFLYYIKNKESCKCPEYHHEKIVIPQEPIYEHKYSTLFNSGPPFDYSRPPVDYSSPPGDHFRRKQYVSSYQKYSRSIEDSIFSNMDILKSIMKKADLTELAFDAMNLKKKSCKKRFVCEADQRAKDNSLLAFTLYMFSDVGFMKYRTNATINSIEDCDSIGQHCYSDNIAR